MAFNRINLVRRQHVKTPAGRSNRSCPNAFKSAEADAITLWIIHSALTYVFLYMGSIAIENRLTGRRRSEEDRKGRDQALRRQVSLPAFCDDHDGGRADGKGRSMVGACGQAGRKRRQRFAGAVADRGGFEQNRTSLAKDV